MKKVHFQSFALVLTVAAILLPSIAAVAKPVELVPTSNDGILVFASEDGMFKWWIDTRVYLDTAFYMEDKNDLGNGTQIRRARMAWKAILWDDWYAEVDSDFAEEATALKDAYVRYDNLFNRHGYLRVGNFRTPFGLEENTSSRYIMFMERSQGTDPFVPGRRIGLEVANWGDMYRVALDAFGPDVEDFETEDQDMNWNVAGRLTVVPIRDEHKVLHLGGAYAMMKPTFTDENDVGEVRFRTRNETHVLNYKFVSTGKMKEAESYTLFGGELAFAMDRLLIQGEYMGATVTMGDVPEEEETRADACCDPSFSGMYGFISYFLTDDTHPYDHTSGEFGQVKPTGKMGAVELAARYSTLNLTDKDAEILGGESTALTVGLNWYPNTNIKIMANYVMVNNDENANADGDLEGNDDYGIFQMRVQAAF